MGKKSRIKAQRAAQAPKSAEDLVNQLLDIDREQKSLQAQIDQLHALKRGQYTKMLAPRPDRQSFTLDQILTPEQIESCIQILNAEPDAGQQHRKIEGYLSPFAQQINAKGLQVPYLAHVLVGMADQLRNPLPPQSPNN
jgi:hypothetical protein